MPVNIVLWHVKSGASDAISNVKYPTSSITSTRSTELNPVPKKTNTCCNFSLCHWNLKSLAVYNFEKVGILNACNTVNKFDIFCISESYLDFSFSSDTKNINKKLVG